MQPQGIHPRLSVLLFTFGNLWQFSAILAICPDPRLPA
jgi:hypothetical protein